MCIWGHIHNALATCPVYEGACVTQPINSTTRDGYKYYAPVHAVVGNGGMQLSGVPESPAAWVAWQTNTWGWSRLTANGTQNLQLTFYDERNVTMHQICSCTTYK